MSFKHKILAYSTALALGLMAPVGAIADTLGDALANAYKHSGLLDQNRALLRAADEDVAATYALLRPIINWSTSVEHSFSRFSSASTLGITTRSDSTTATVAIAAQLLLYDAGASRYSVEAAKETVLATRQTLINVEQQVLLSAVQAFMNVRRDTEIVALRENNLRLLSRELQAAKDRFEVGEVTRTDVSLAEAALAGARAELAVARGNLVASQEFYGAAVGHKPGALTPPSRLPQTANSVDAAKALAVTRHPNLVEIQHSISAAEFAVKRARAQMRPSVSLNGALSAVETHDSSNFTQGGSVSIDLTQPIYQGGQLSALLRRAMHQRDATRAGLHVTRHNIEQQVGTAWANLRATRAQREASERQIRAARLAFQGVREEATLGSRTTLDVLDAEQTLLDAEASRITARSNEFVAAYTLLSSMGLLTAEHLNLQVEQYDPAAYYNQVKKAPAIISKRGKRLDKVLRRLGKE